MSLTPEQVKSIVEGMVRNPPPGMATFLGNRRTALMSQALVNNNNRPLSPAQEQVIQQQLNSELAQIVDVGAKSFDSNDGMQQALKGAGAAFANDVQNNLGSLIGNPIGGLFALAKNAIGSLIGAIPAVDRLKNRVSLMFGGMSWADTDKHVDDHMGAKRVAQALATRLGASEDVIYQHMMSKAADPAKIAGPGGTPAAPKSKDVAVAMEQAPAVGGAAVNPNRKVVTLDTAKLADMGIAAPAGTKLRVEGSIVQGTTPPNSQFLPDKNKFVLISPDGTETKLQNIDLGKTLQIRTTGAQQQLFIPAAQGLDMSVKVARAVRYERVKAATQDNDLGKHLRATFVAQAGELGLSPQQVEGMVNATRVFYLAGGLKDRSATEAANMLMEQKVFRIPGKQDALRALLAQAHEQTAAEAKKIPAGPGGADTAALSQSVFQATSMSVEGNARPSGPTDELTINVQGEMGGYSSAHKMKVRVDTTTNTMTIVEVDGQRLGGPAPQKPAISMKFDQELLTSTSLSLTPQVQARMLAGTNLVIQRKITADKHLGEIPDGTAPTTPAAGTGALATIAR